jgi:hypothetical protein
MQKTVRFVMINQPNTYALYAIDMYVKSITAKGMKCA